MYYQLPPYPTTTLETLVYMDTLARRMIQEQNIQLQGYNHIVAIVLPIGPIMHVGSMVMMMLNLIHSHNHTNNNYTIVYDPNILGSDQTHILLDSHDRLTTRFGHQVTIQSSITQLPTMIEELCCMLQIYVSILTPLAVLTIDQVDQINPDTTVLWIAGNLHQGLSLEDSMIADETAISQLSLGHIDNTNIVSYQLLRTMRQYYHHRDETYYIIPNTYHNTALLDGQKSHTTGYTGAVIVQE